MGAAGHGDSRRRRPLEETEKPQWRMEPRQGRMGDSGAVTEIERKGIGAAMGFGWHSKEKGNFWVLPGTMVHSRGLGRRLGGH